MTQKQEIVLTAYDDSNEAVVSINHEAIKALTIPPGAATLMASGLAPDWLSHPLQAIAYYIALNSINYRFWDMVPDAGPSSFVRYVFEGDKGAMGMRRAFDKVWGPGFTPDNFRAQPITPEWVKQHFGDIPDLQSRAEVLSNVFAGGALEEVSAELYRRILANGALSADDAKLLHDAFPRAFNDPYMKRAQLAVSWIAGYFAEVNVRVDVTDLTAFADYQVPRTLRALNLIVYSSELAHKVDSYIPLPEGGFEERAIRAATILVCELLAKALGVTAAEIDNFLWLNRNLAGATPFHLTFTEQY
jgi:hypothetical protein